MNIKDWMEKLKSPPAKETKAEARNRQNQWMTQQSREWQLAWNALFDQDPGQATADNAVKSDEIPDDIESDFRLQCGFCEVTRETRAACFALLPKGQELAERFEQFYNSRNAPISDNDALKLVKELGDEIKLCKVKVEAAWDNIILIDKNDEAAAAFETAADVSYLFEAGRFDLRSEAKLPELAARIFLTDILIMVAGKFYEPGDWITGVYREPATDRCLHIIYKLWLGGRYVRIGEEGVAVFLR